jgi:hypothetical protein
MGGVGAVPPPQGLRPCDPVPHPSENRCNTSFSLEIKYEEPMRACLRRIEFSAFAPSIHATLLNGGNLRTQVAPKVWRALRHEIAPSNHSTSNVRSPFLLYLLTLAEFDHPLVDVVRFLDRLHESGLPAPDSVTTLRLLPNQWPLSLKLTIHLQTR